MFVNSVDRNTFLFANRRLYQAKATALESLDLWFPLPLAHWALLDCQHVYVAFSPCNCSIRWMVKADATEPVEGWASGCSSGLARSQLVTSCEESSRHSIIIYEEAKSNTKQEPTALGQWRENTERNLLQLAPQWPFKNVHGFCLQRR